MPPQAAAAAAAAAVAAAAVATAATAAHPLRAPTAGIGRGEEYEPRHISPVRKPPHGAAPACGISAGRGAGNPLRLRQMRSAYGRALGVGVRVGVRVGVGVGC